MNACRIVLSLVLFGTTACLEARKSDDVLKANVVPASAQSPYSAEVRFVATVRPTSPDVILGIPEMSIGCWPGGGPFPIVPDFMKPGTKGFPKLPTEADYLALAQDQLPDGWSLGRPLEGVAKCCFIGGVWVPCHPGWETRGFPIQRGTGPEARPYSRTITIAKNDMEESIELEFWVVVSAGEGQSGASGDGR